MEMDEKFVGLLYKSERIVSVYSLEKKLLEKGITFRKDDVISTLNSLEKMGAIEKIGNKAFVNRLSIENQQPD
ncbi:hypothetical protein [Acidianus brierleyi]|uniref:Uncharacterized protein n=1 Tax=Acidianus brierleyi TaxID=41673 RepID=A0A2U9IHG8_9CREN|nr:hypothetical protein [Acidianus brierleyi]AWR95451.1 hypothetical protein DFR85_13480 [Acidianus brierleyi]